MRAVSNRLQMSQKATTGHISAAHGRWEKPRRYLSWALHGAIAQGKIARAYLGSLPCTIRVASLTALTFLAAMILLRVAFYIAYVGESEACAGDVLRAFYLGVKFDLRLSLLIALPVVLLMLLPFVNPLRLKVTRHVMLTYMVAVFCGCLLLYLLDFGQYSWNRVRLNSSLLAYLWPLRVALLMVWQSYPVVSGALLLVLVGYGYSLVARRVVLKQLDHPSRPRRTWRQIGLGATFFLLFTAGLYGRMSRIPLFWSEAYFSADPFVSALGLNPILYFFSSIQSDRLDVDEEEVRKHHEFMAGFLELDDRDASSLDLLRHVSPSPRVPGSPNVVLIFLESFAWFQLGVSGNELAPTPEFDRIAGNSQLFTNFSRRSI